MRIFQRLGDILTASLNDLVDRCENPSAMLRQAIREMESHVETSLASAVEVVATEKLLTKQLADERDAAVRWRAVAAEAIAVEDDARAREALARAIEHEDVATALDDQLRRTAQQARRLRNRAAALRAKLAEAQRRYQVLAARERAAAAERLVDGPGRASLRGVNRLADRLDRAEARVAAEEELATDGWADELVDHGRQQRVEAALAALKVAKC